MRGSVDGETSSEVEGATWRVLKTLATNLHGNFKAESCESLVEQVLNAYRVMGCKMSLKFFLCVITEIVMTKTEISAGCFQADWHW
jgi:hypothetical protein